MTIELASAISHQPGRQSLGQFGRRAGENPECEQACSRRKGQGCVAMHQAGAGLLTVEGSEGCCVEGCVCWVLV